MSSTRTGNFPIGFRALWSEWAKDVPGLARWGQDHGFSAIDLNKPTRALLDQIRATGLRIGSVDMPNWGAYITADPSARAAAAAEAAAYIRDLAADAPLNFFSVFLPPDKAAPRAETFKLLVEGLKPIVAALEDTGSKLAVEGYPGAGAPVISPETYRALYAALPSDALAMTYDPSHLLRMNIDPMRFLKEFVSRVVHVHGKDTRIDSEAVYTHGTELPATFAQGPAFGTPIWRYTIPGHGVTDWTATFAILQQAGYAGCVCIELEDCNFNGTEAGDKAGLVFGKAFLEGC